jgi:hypothetical protein
LLDGVFSTATERIDARSMKVRVLWNGAPLGAQAAYELLASEMFRSALLADLAGAPYAAYFWETPPVTVATSGRPFQYVLTDAPGLASAAAEVGAFQEHFSNDADRDGVVTFPNLGGDATLIAPCPLDQHSTYAHLAAFVRNAAEPQKHALFAALGSAALSHLSDRPLWISTAGMGVYWLHVRLDSTPKYYRHAPYKRLGTEREL